MCEILHNIKSVLNPSVGYKAAFENMLNDLLLPVIPALIPPLG